MVPFDFDLRTGVACTKVPLAPRSISALTSPARTEWEHSIPVVGGLRYSITFRTLRTK
jgi:hypothetical protein